MQETGPQRPQAAGFHLYETPRTGTSAETERRVGVARAGGTDERERLPEGHAVSIWGEEKVLELGSDDGCETS